ncbi:MAG: sigma 54-interacting transcriptional regulator [Polyangiaceae bacterium]|nr:sigma 54-interacting transcriptional regulator [Polyangiaceae bacterium]
MFDAALKRPGASGVLNVDAPAAVLDALAAHATRRARAAGRSVISVGRAPTDDPVRELCTHVAGSTPADPLAAADAIARGLVGSVAIIVDKARSAWAATVLDALAGSLTTEGDNGSLVVVLSSGAARSHEALFVRGTFGPEESRAFWEAIGQEVDRTVSPRFNRFDGLERWWGSVQSGPLHDNATRPSAAALRLLARMALSERSWHPGDLVRLGSPEARDELLNVGAVEVGPRGQAASLSPEWEKVRDRAANGASFDPEDARAVAEVLEKGVAPLHGEPRHDGDAWALLRAAELFALAGENARAEAAATRAIVTVADADARADFWQRWQRAQTQMTGDDMVPRLLRSAELALRVGDADRALELARSAVSVAGNTYEATLILGRAMAARGDLTTAALALTRATEIAADGGAKARAGVEMAEVHYVVGQIDDARRLAEEAFAIALDAPTRLKARNVLGKLLLDKAKWNDAEQHFAADAWEAACAGDPLSELRARLNRAIALMSGDRRDEARTMLTTVLADGETQGQLRAVCFALANLATIALWKHEYGTALSLSERSIVFARRLGDKVLLAQLITNLSELRLFFGLVKEAEQALAFGRKACGAVVASKLASHFALASAQIHLARGQTMEALSEVKTAIGAAEVSRAGGHLARCHRIAARIALEDGDVARAIAALERAKVGSTNTNDRAEALVIEAMLAQAQGKPYIDLAAEALALAGQAYTRVLSIEAHVLLCQALQDTDPNAARSHLSMAVAVRNRIADSLPDDMRPRFLELRDLATLNKIEAAFETSDVAPSPTTLRAIDPIDDVTEPAPSLARVVRPAGPVDRKIVGRDPSIVSLLSAVQKIGPSDATVLVHGESGTGKELIAEAIHSASQRRTGPLVKVNCAALVETLLLSELFGHEKGAFTGAVARRRGRFEMADGGTLFLDEIGDISARTQVALLRVLQEKTFERVGGVTPIRANVRVVCATHRDLKTMVSRGEFREDLYFRLTGVVLEVPALRQRISDLPLIAEAIFARIGAERGTPPKRLSPAALQGLLRHKWPGNIRELENALRAASLFAEGDAIELADLVANVDSLRQIDVESVTAPVSLPSPPLRPSTPPAPISAPQTDGTVPAEDDPDSDDASFAPSRNARVDGADPTEVAYVHIRSGVSLHDLKRNIERECIQRALTESKGNITRAAALLGMKRPRLSQLVKQYGFGGVSEDDT